MTRRKGSDIGPCLRHASLSMRLAQPQGFATNSFHFLISFPYSDHTHTAFPYTYLLCMLLGVGTDGRSEFLLEMTSLGHVHLGLVRLLRNLYDLYGTFTME